MGRLFLFFKQVFQDSISVSWTLFRIMIPTILVLKVIEEAGGIVYLSQLLDPVMSAVGLPSELGLVWATTLLVNIYSGLLVLINLRLFSNSRLLNYPLLKKLVIASIDHEYRPNFRSHQ
ncbi:hypothetical protein [Endozoicomonas atrinae]|uniref:hypothetical protein n=1 Tax=Endozoicomonas atrinae TaxID=1333660 RepID=UPI003AFFE1D1